eukprot:TRINITY_DN3239_c0_g1_i5.p2 TRINITY_DN3239_c0_g1~~TRINITY_DN3239_c0_g1_i5.p2  ORF type:complete len:165 (+),score=11.28 TRINITY_DN3239_c0_g1_i5:175-669(+)
MTALLTIASQVQADLSSTVPPAQNFDMSHWKLTLPVDRNGGVTGEAMEMSSSQLATMPGYSAKWFKTASNGGLSMEAAINGATTSGSSYPRSELREQMVTGSDSANWYASGNAVLPPRRRCSCSARTRRPPTRPAPGRRAWPCRPVSRSPMAVWWSPMPATTGC